MSKACLACAHGNRDTAKFRCACGRSFAPVCTVCGAEQTPRPAGPPAPVVSDGERKQVTALFADVGEVVVGALGGYTAIGATGHARRLHAASERN